MNFQKRLLLSVAVVLTANCFLVAQASFGLRGGVNLAKTSSKGGGFEVTTDAITGLNFAAVLELGITESFAIQPEFAFLQKGANLKDFDVKTVINYLEVPVLAKFKFGGESFGAYIAAGPSFGYAISGKGNGEKIEDWEDYARLELGGNLGGGLGLKLAGSFIYLDLRYLVSLSNLNSGEDDFTVRNRGIGISAGFLKSLGD